MTEDWKDEAYYYDEYYDAAPARRWTTPVLVLSGLIGILIGFACAVCLGGTGLVVLLLTGGDTSSATGVTPVPTPVVIAPPMPLPTPLPAPPPVPEQPQPTPVPEQPQPAPTPEQPAYASGGLGLSQPEWEQRYGPGSPSDTPGLMWYQGGTYLVAFQEGNVSYIERQWSPENASNIDDSRLQSGELTPADKQYIQTYIPEDRLELIVDLYLSPSIVTRFGGNVWGSGEPGNFTVAHTLLESGVTKMVVALGNNP